MSRLLAALTDFHLIFFFTYVAHINYKIGDKIIRSHIHFIAWINSLNYMAVVVILSSFSIVCIELIIEVKQVYLQALTIWKMISRVRLLYPFLFLSFSTFLINLCVVFLILVFFSNYFCTAGIAKEKLANCCHSLLLFTIFYSVNIYVHKTLNLICVFQIIFKLYPLVVCVKVFFSSYSAQ